MRIATWNVNSVRSRLERVLAWTERERPDVLCLQEIKTTDDLFPLEPFTELGYRAEVFGQKTYNGVALLSLKPVTKVARNLPDDEPGAPSRLIAGTVGRVRIVNVYVPNGQSPESDKFVYKLAWLARLRDFLEATASPSDPLILLGDFNIAPEERDVRYIEQWRGGIHFHPKEHKALAADCDSGRPDACASLDDESHVCQLSVPTAFDASVKQTASIVRYEVVGQHPRDSVPVAGEHLCLISLSRLVCGIIELARSMAR